MRTRHLIHSLLFLLALQLLTGSLAFASNQVLSGVEVGGMHPDKPLPQLSSTPKFMTLPFHDTGVQVTEGWLCPASFGSGICGQYTPYGAHHAVDYAKFSGGSPVSFDVLAAASGTATCYPPGSSYGSLGNMILINHDGLGAGYSTIYGHLASCEFSSRYVTQGERIGNAGNTGGPYQIHLHFVFRDSSTASLDPYDLWTDNIPSYPQPGQTSPLAGANHYWTTNPPSLGTISTSTNKNPPLNNCFTWLNDTRIDCFVRGTDNRMHQRYWNGGGWSEFDLGGTLASAPTCFPWLNGSQIHCFARGTDNRMYQRYWNGGGWSDWIDLGGTLASAPACFPWLNGSQIHCFVRGTDNRMYQRFWNGAWSAWVDLGGTLASAPTCFPWLNGSQVHCFARGTDNRMYQRYWNGGGWPDWIDLGGTLASAPTCFPWLNGSQIHCFARGTDNRMYQRFWNGAWSDWIDLGGTLASAPTCFSWLNDTRIDCFAQGTDNSLQQRYWNGGWSNWINLGGSVNLTVEEGTVAPPNQAPNIPTLLTPPHTSTTNTTTPTFTWKDNGDPDNGPQPARSFRVRVSGMDGKQVAISDWLNATSWTSPGLSNGTYAWQVQAFDGSVESGWSGAWNVTIAGSGPPPPPYFQSNYTAGGPGSTFIFTAGNFPSNAQATIAIREPAMSDFRVLVTMPISGSLVFILPIPTSAAPGVYTVRIVVNSTASLTASSETQALLSLEQTLTIVDGGYVIPDPQQDVPRVTIPTRVYLPLIQR